MGSLEEAPRETQVAAKSFVPTNAFLFVERLQCVLSTGRYQWTGVQLDGSTNVQDLSAGPGRPVVLF